MKIVLIIVVLIAAAIAITLFWALQSTTVSKEIQYGPFVIKAVANTAKTYNGHYGMVNQTTVRYSIWFNGEPIQFPSDLQTNTGLPFLWKVYALKNAADPTLLAGSQSLYLIYLKDGQAVVEPLLVQGSDFANLQFLDSNDGQPGRMFEVYMRSEVEGMEKLESLEGGNLLLVSGHLVLDIGTGKKWEFRKNNASIDNYSFPSPQGALVLSPNKKCIAFHAEFDSWNTSDENLPDSEHAIAVYDFVNDTGYVVKYDDTDTRMTNAETIDLVWFNTYFEWKALGSGDDRLQLRKIDKPTNWLGRFDERDNYFYLYPVKASMNPVFLEFVLTEMGWTKSNILTDETGEYTGRTMVLADANTKLDIVFKEDEQQISFSKHLYLPSDSSDKFYPALVQRISDAFNAELSSGKHQEHFGKIISESKRIRSY